MTSTILPTRNEAWGFFGTLSQAGADPMRGRAAASAAIAAETDAAPEAVYAAAADRALGVHA